MAFNARLLVVWWILSVWIVNLSTVRSQNCAPSPAVGPGSTVSRSEYTTDDANDSLFLIANPHSIGCYGVITRWSFRSAQDLEDGPCYVSRAQIWRPSPPGPMEYLLVGENGLFDMDFCLDNLSSSADNDKEFSWSVPPSSKIPVQPGDVIAWYDINSGNRSRKIGFDSGLPGSTTTMYVLPGDSACTRSSVGNGPCSWQASSEVGRNYGIEIQLDVESRFPLLLNLPNTITITELLPVGTFVFQVEASNKFTWNPTITPPLLYSILPSTTCNTSWFEIDSANGSITVANLFNVNPPTAPTLPCKVDVQVQQIGGQTSNGSLTVNVININEPHQIDNLPQTVTLDSTKLGTSSFTVIDVTFTDPDLISLDANYSKIFSIVDISPPYPIFTIASSGANVGQVSTTQALNFWTGPDVFNISIILSDTQFVDGPKILTVILTNLIKPPVLTNLNATVFFDETTTIGTSIYDVSSSFDKRPPPIHYPTYAILSQVPYPGVGSMTFAITSNTGVGTVKLSSALDYLSVKQYTIEIQATITYGTTTLFSSTGILTVNVKWIDRAPTISIAPISTDMSEDVAVGTPVPGITITANDREYDNNLGDYLVFHVSDPHFVVDNVTKTMYTSASLFILSPNVICNQIYDLQVVARDSYGKVSNTSPLTVNVERGNRESPTFTEEQYNGSVAESGVGGSPTGVQLIATDPDCLNNGTITYSILGDLPNLYFQVDPGTGIITQKQTISQPTYPNMTFTVLASDGGQPSLNSTALVFIVVNATNAHAPSFEEEYIEIETRSDSPVGSSIYTLNVTDPDSVLVNNINYEIIVVQDDFDVRSSGDIVPKRKLSSYKRYSLYVMATDTGQGAKDYFTDPATVVIDTYDAANQLINIEMLRPLSETDPKLPEFIAKLNDFLKPWMVKMEDLKYDGDNTIVTIYAYDTGKPFSSEPTPKRFIDRDDLLAKMRTDIYGTPVDGLRGPEFADYEIVSVDPAYPVWVLDTVEGIATLTVVCVVALALIITAIVLLLKHFKMACFRQDKVGPAPQKTEPTKGESDLEEFQLSYANTQPLEANTGDVTVYDLEPFERPPTYKANTPPPLRPDAALEL